MPHYSLGLRARSRKIAVVKIKGSLRASIIATEASFLLISFANPRFDIHDLYRTKGLAINDIDVYTYRPCFRGSDGKG
jgi:hypothetical protein